jgi:hypothetical protein
VLNIHKGDRVRLSDGQHHELGVIVVGAIDGNTVYGDFVRADYFSRVKHLFEEYERLANKKTYKPMLRVEAKIAALDLHATSDDHEEHEAYAVEIWRNNFVSVSLRPAMAFH